MNILYVTDEVQVSGATTFQQGFIPEIEKKGHNVDLFLFADPNKSATKAYVDLCHHYFRQQIHNHFSKTSLWKRFVSLWKYLQQKSEYDLWVVDMPYTLIPMALVKFIGRSKVPLIFIFHGSNTLQETDLDQPSLFKRLRLRLFKKIESVFYQHPDRVFVFSTFSKHLLSQQMNVPSAKIVVSFPGIDPIFEKVKNRVSRQEAKTKLGFSSDRKLFVVAGRIEPRKGIVPLVKSFTTWSKKADVSLVVLSNFSEQFDTLFDLESTDDLRKQLIFVHKPSRERLALFFRAADCVILPSVAWETLGFVTLEALAAHSPVAAFSIAANPELLPPTHLVPFRNEQSDFETLLEKAYLVSNVDLVPSIERFNWKAYLDSFFNHV